MWDAEQSIAHFVSVVGFHPPRSQTIEYSYLSNKGMMKSTESEDLDSSRDKRAQLNVQPCFRDRPAPVTRIQDGNSKRSDTLFPRRHDGLSGIYTVYNRATGAAFSRIILLLLKIRDFVWGYGQCLVNGGSLPDAKRMLPSASSVL